MKYYNLFTIFALIMLFTLAVLLFPDLFLQLILTFVKTTLKLKEIVTESIVFQMIINNNLNTFLNKLIPFDFSFLFMVKIIFMFLFVILNIIFFFSDSKKIRLNKNLSVKNKPITAGPGSGIAATVRRIVVITAGVISSVSGIIIFTNEIYSNEAREAARVKLEEELAEAKNKSEELQNENQDLQYTGVLQQHRVRFLVKDLITFTNDRSDIRDEIKKLKTD